MTRSVYAAWLLLLAAAPIHAQTPSLLVLSKADATLAIVDPVNLATVARIPTGDGPHEVEVSADGKLAFVSNYGGQTPGNTLSVIDIARRREIHRVDLGPLQRPHGLAVARGKLYFTSETAQKVGRYDPVADRVDWQFDTAQQGTHMVVADRDGSRLFTANMASGSIGIIEGGTGEAGRQTLVKVGAGPEGLDLSPDGRELWTAHSGDGGLSIIDVATGKVVRALELGTKRSNRVKFTPDGRLALVSDLSGGELVVLDVRERKERARIPLGRNPSGILVAPDGARAYVAVSGEARVAIVDLKTLAVTGSIQTGGGPDGLAWVR